MTKTNPHLLYENRARTLEMLDIAPREFAPGNKLCRISEYAGTWNYVLWTEDKMMYTRYMHEDMRPEWMRVLCDAAVMGDHVQYITHPPPSQLIWCEVDADNKLVKFIRSKGNVS